MMNDKMKKMLGKKRDLSSTEQSAKMDVVKDMIHHAKNAMHGKMGGMKKVSVMSNSSKGLSDGLSKAKGILSGHDEQDMLNDASAPYSDIEHAHDEHMEEKGPNSLGQEQSQEDSEGKYFDGGSVEDYDGSDVEESPDKGDYEMQDQESPASHEEGEDSDEDSMSEQEINEKLEKLMRAKERISRR